MSERKIVAHNTIDIDAALVMSCKGSLAVSSQPPRGVTVRTSRKSEHP